MIYASCAVVLSLLVYRIVTGPDAVVLRSAVFVTLVGTLAKIVHKHTPEWVSAIYSFVRTWLKR